MTPILVTNDPGTIAFAQAVLKDARIEHFVLDQNMSILEPGLLIPKRLMVLDDDAVEAREALTDAGLGRDLQPA